jgi:hypothetical protein
VTPRGAVGRGMKGGEGIIGELRLDGTHVRSMSRTVSPYPPHPSPSSFLSVPFHALREALREAQVGKEGECRASLVWQGGVNGKNSFMHKKKSTTTSFAEGKGRRHHASPHNHCQMDPTQRLAEMKKYPHSRRLLQNPTPRSTTAICCRVINPTWWPPLE